MENEEYVDETVDDDDEVSDEYIQNMIRENKKKFRNKNLNDLKILYEHNLETYNKHPHDESTNAFFLYFLKPLKSIIDEKKAILNLKFREIGKKFKFGNDVCSICHEELKGEKLLTLTCGHIFHEKCVCSWLWEHNTCPLCRKPHQTPKYDCRDFILGPNSAFQPDDRFNHLFNNPPPQPSIFNCSIQFGSSKSANINKFKLVCNDIKYLLNK